MKTPDFRPAIRRALNRPCNATLGRIAPSHALLTGSYVITERLASIRKLFDQAPAPLTGINCRYLAKLFKVTRETIARDIRHLKRHGLTLGYDQHTYCYTK